MSAIQEAAGAGESLALTQRGQLKSFLWLSLRNGLLNVVTLTLYRFWGKTEVRRRLWATTCLNDEPFEYTGRGSELFLGFLLAVALIALPFLVVVFGAQFLGPALAGLVILPLYLFLLFLAGFGRFTAFRYLATRSSWRGVRFHLRGAPGGFGLAWMGYVLLSAVTLGWFWPAADRRLSGRLWNGLSFGDHDFAFRIEDARRQPVYGAYAVSWVLAIVGYVLFVAVITAAMLPQIQAAQRSGAPPHDARRDHRHLCGGGRARAVLRRRLRPVPRRHAALGRVRRGVRGGPLQAAARLVRARGTDADEPGAPASGPLARRTPPGLERQIGDNFEAQVALGFRPCGGSAGQAALASLGKRLGGAAGAPFEIRVRAVHAPVLNAFALPGGVVMVTDQLIDFARSPDELAAVIAHETAHVRQRHVMQAVWRSFGFGVLLDAMVGGGSGAGQQLVLLAGSVTNLRYGREAEAEADRVGQDLLAQQGLSSQGMATFFQRLGGAREGRNAQAVKELISDHPDTLRRADASRARARPGAAAFTPVEWRDIKVACHDGYAPLERLHRFF